MVEFNDQERALMRLLADGCTNNKQLAKSTGLAPGSVKQYFHNIYAKLGFSGAGSMARLALWAKENLK